MSGGDSVAHIKPAFCLKLPDHVADESGMRIQDLLIVIAAVLSVAGLNASCSLFSSRSEKVEKSGGFRSATPANEIPQAVPAEIANDIAVIAAGRVPALETAATSADQEGESFADESRSAGPDEDRYASDSSTDDRDQDEDDEGAPSRLRAKKVPRKGSTESYRVRRGDTLMKIAFAKYGDLYRWREILQHNRQALKSGELLYPGTILQVPGVGEVIITRNGEPYLIKRHDTLVKISSSLYGSSSHWKALWQNNPELIRDPNKIYAGFTMYYLNDKVRKPATDSVVEPAGTEKE